LPSEGDTLAIATLFDRAERSRLALVHGEERWTFARLEDEAERLAGWLTGQGVSKGDLVAFALPNGPWFVALTFAIYRCGAVPAPLSPGLAPNERDTIITTMRPAIFVADGDIPTNDATRGPAPTGRPVSPSWKACTSGGSTGRPKVIVDGRPAAFPPSTEFIGIPGNAVVLVPGPLYHNAPFSCLVFALWRGSTVVTMPRFDAREALSLIERERVSWALMVPTMMSRILDLDDAVRSAFDLKRWDMVVHTAAPLAPWQKHAWIEWRGPEHVWEVYGATEGLVRCWIGGREWLERPGSVGKPIGGARLRILDGSGTELAPGEIGEIFAMPAGGPTSTYHYIGAQRRATPDGWESVGDAGWLDEEGYLYLADRNDDLIISGGVNIWPAEVEAALLRHPAIVSCAVFGVPDPDLGSRVHAVLESETDIDPGALSRFLADHLSRAKQPRSYEFQRGPVRDDAGKFRKPRREITR